MALSNTDLFLVQDATTKANYQISFENFTADLAPTYVEVAGDNMTGDLTLGPVGDSKITFSSSTGNGSFGGDLDITGKGTSASTASDDPDNTLVTKDYADYEIAIGGRWEEDGNKLYPKNLNAAVGIGTDSPGALLHLAANAPYIKFEDKDNNQDWTLQATAWFALRNASNDTELVRVAADSTITAAGPINVPQSIADGEGVNINEFGNVAIRRDDTTKSAFQISKGAGTGNRTIRMLSDGSATFDGDVGIGTDSPGKKLHVKDSASNLVRVESTSTAARVEFVASGTTSTDQVSLGALGNDLQLNAGGATRATVKSDGNVGIGTTAPQANLQIGGATATGVPTLFLSRSPSVSNTSDIALSANAVIRGESSIRNVINDGGIFSWYVGGTDNKAGTAGSSEKMRLDANGDVGIGTDSPTGKLDVNGTVRAWSTTETCRFKTKRTSGDFFTLWSDAASIADGTKISSISADGTGYYANALGIGGTAVGKLAVYGSNDAISVTPSQFTTNIKTNTAYLHLGGVNGYPALQGSGTGTAYHMLLNPLEGRVGIGTEDTPQGMLDVQTAAGEHIIFDSAGDNQQPRIRLMRDGGADYDFVNSVGSFKFYRNTNIELYRFAGDSHVWSTEQSGEAMRIKGDTNFVGIGTDTPSAPLQVVGTNEQNGVLRVTGNVNNPNLDFYFAQELTATLTGDTTTTGDREQGGIHIDVNSSATGGGTNHEHRVYGVFADIDCSGDPDLVYGLYGDATVTPTTGTVGSVYGVYGRAEDNGGAGNTSTVCAVRGEAVADNSTSDVNSLYGGWLKANIYNDAGATNIISGVLAEVEIATGTTNTNRTPTVQVVRSEYDNNGDVSQTSDVTLFYGNFAGKLPTTAYGVYINDDVPSVFKGSIQAKSYDLEALPTLPES